MADTVDEVVARLEETGARLGAADGVACFNRMYLTVTRLVRDEIGAGSFADPDAMNALDVVFANLYLDALDADAAGARLPRAWAPLFAQRADSRVASLQFAIAGMNAHINHDLPVAVVATCERLGTRPDAGSFRDDYLRVTELLARVEREVRESYVSDAELGLAEVGAVLDLVGVWSIDKARDAAWVNAEVLWRLRDVDFLADAFTDTLARSVGLASGGLLAPLLPA